MQIRCTAVAFVALLAVFSTAGARDLLAAAPAAAPMMAPAMAPMSAQAPAPAPVMAAADMAAPAPAPVPVPTQTPAPAGCALSYIQGNSSYSMFAQILYATPSSANLSAILSDQVSGITVFLPTNEAINTTFNKFGLDMEGLLKNQHLCTEILQYHILPSPIEYAAFKEGYSFNTLLEGQDLRDSLRVKRSGDNIKVASGKTTATVGTNGAKICMDSIFPISMLLLPRNSVQASGSSNPSS